MDIGPAPKIMPRFGPGAPAPGPGSSPQAVIIYKPGFERPLAKLVGIEVPGDESALTHDFTLDKRFFLIPDAKVFIAIPPSNDCLILHRVDLDKALAAQDR